MKPRYFIYFRFWFARKWSLSTNSGVLPRNKNDGFEDINDAHRLAEEQHRLNHHIIYTVGEGANPPPPLTLK